MKKSILIEILHSLTRRELNIFKDYVYSPFFNKNENTRRLCDYVLRYAPTFQSKELTRPNAYEAVYGTNDYQELRINNVISDLLQLLYAYISFKQRDKTPLQQQANLIEALISQKTLRSMPRILRRAEQQQVQAQHRSLDFYQSKYVLAAKTYEYEVIQGKLEGSQSLQQVSDSLDVYYWYSKLRLACEMLNRQSVVGTECDPRFLEVFLAYYQTQEANFSDLPALKIYYETYFFLLEPSPEKYENLSTLLLAQHSIFPKKELRHLYTLLLNYCIRQGNFGDTSYHSELLRIYDILIEQDILLQDGYLTKRGFLNATTAGIRSKHYDWTETFIQKYAPYLKEAERQNTVDYQLAALYFAKGELEQTFHLLQQVEFTDIFYHASAKLIQLKVYYELGEIEPFYSLVRATLNVLRRSRKLNDYHRASYANFVKLAKKLHDIKISLKPNVKAKLRQVAAQLETTTPLANKGWLLEKYQILAKEKES